MFSSTLISERQLFCIWIPINELIFENAFNEQWGEKSIKIRWRIAISFHSNSQNVNGEWFCEGFFFSIKDISAYQWISKCIVRLNWYASIHINRSETRCLYPQWIVINVCSSNFYIIISALKRTNANALRFIGSFDTFERKMNEIRFFVDYELFLKISFHFKLQINSSIPCNNNSLIHSNCLNFFGSMNVHYFRLNSKLNHIA